MTSLTPLNSESQALLNHNGFVCLYTCCMSIGARIRQLRETNKLSGEKFGEMCGLSKGAISQWENNDVTPPVDRLIELKKHIDFSIDWLYTGNVSIAEQISQKLTAKERAAWYRVGNSLAEPEDKGNGTQ